MENHHIQNWKRNSIKTLFKVMTPFFYYTPKNNNFYLFPDPGRGVIEKSCFCRESLFQHLEIGMRGIQVPPRLCPGANVIKLFTAVIYEFSL